MLGVGFIAGYWFSNSQRDAYAVNVPLTCMRTASEILTGCKGFCSQLANNGAACASGCQVYYDTLSSCGCFRRILNE